MKNVVIHVPFPTMSFSPIYLAHDGGFLTREGIGAQITFYSPPGRYIELMSQEGQFMPLTTFATRALVKGIRPLLVCSMFNQVVHRLVAQPEITNIWQLNGKTVMVNALGGTSDLEARHVMKSVGFDPKQVSYVEAGPGLEVAQVNALRKREVDAIASSHPFWLVLEREGYHVLGDSEGACGRWLANGLFGNRAFLQREPDLVKAIQKAFQSGFDLARNDPAEATAIILRNIPDMEEEIVRHLVERLTMAWDPAVDLTALQRFVALFCDVYRLRQVKPSEFLFGEA